MDKTLLRAQHSGFLKFNSGSSPGQVRDSTTIIELLDEIEKLREAGTEMCRAWGPTIRGWNPVSPALNGLLRVLEIPDENKIPGAERVPVGSKVVESKECSDG